MIKVTILADSVNLHQTRLTTFLLTYPRFIHSEFMTHRCFSRNAASSRAIPIQRMLDAVALNPAWPEQWGSNKSGMQAGDPLPADQAEYVKIGLDRLRIDAIDAVRWASEVTQPGLHKQVANRYLEPWSHITVLATATDGGLMNFFALRAHPAAQPEFQVLAYRMLDAYLRNNVKLVKWGEWHIPNFGGPTELDVADSLRIATARCCRLSYLTFDGDHSPEKDFDLHDRSVANGHWSPFEHSAQATQEMEELAWSSNFDTAGEWSGWKQYRKNFTTENQVMVNLNKVMASKPDWINV